jgi:cytoskeleton protein RodZ
MGGFDDMDAQTSIGSTLRQHREERGLTVEQAAFQSKVPLRLVQALESDDYHLLPDALYLIRLLRDYAVFLKLDAVALETEFLAAIRRPTQTSLSVAPAPRPAPTIPWKQVLWTVAAILVVTPLVFIALSLASKRASDHVAQAPVVETRVEEATQGAGETPSTTDRLLGSALPSGSVVPATMTEQAVPPPVETHEASTTVGPIPARPAATDTTAAGAQVLVATARESTWLSVRADDQERKEVLLQAGQSTQFGAEKRFHVIVGNAGGVTLWYNGTPLPALGRSGEVVRDLVLPPPGAGVPSTGGVSPPTKR